MSTLVRFFIITLSAVTVAACSVFNSLYMRQDVVKNRDKEYLKAENRKPLEMPPGIALAGDEPVYPIPNVKATQVGFTDDALFPPGSVVARKAKETRAAKMLQTTDELELSSEVVTADNGRSVLNIEQTGTGAWNAVGLALLTANYTIVRQDRIYGIFYVVPNNAIGGASALLSGVKLSNSGLLDMGGVDVSFVNDKGSPLPSDLEKQMLNTLSQHVNRLSSATTATKDPLVRLLTKDIDGNPTLLLNRGREQAWTLVERTLAKSSYHIVRRNKESTTFYVAAANAAGNIGNDSALYSVYLRSQGGITRVVILNEDLSIPSYRQAEVLLTAINHNL
jgi:uncharacterized lipoprotein